MTTNLNMNKYILFLYNNAIINETDIVKSEVKIWLKFMQGLLIFKPPSRGLYFPAQSSCKQVQFCFLATQFYIFILLQI